jgi:hypothetical protein
MRRDSGYEQSGWRIFRKMINRPADAFPLVVVKFARAEVQGWFGSGSTVCDNNTGRGCLSLGCCYVDFGTQPLVLLHPVLLLEAAPFLYTSFFKPLRRQASLLIPVDAVRPQPIVDWSLIATGLILLAASFALAYPLRFLNP